MLQFLSYIGKPFISCSDTGVEFIASKTGLKLGWNPNWFSCLSCPNQNQFQKFSKPHERQFYILVLKHGLAAVEEKKNMLRLHVDDSQMEWVCEQHQKGKYLYTNACCNQVICLQRAFFLGYVNTNDPFYGSVYIHDHRAANSPRLFARPSCS